MVGIFTAAGAVLAAALALALHRHLAFRYQPGPSDPEHRRAKLPGTDTDDTRAHVYAVTNSDGVQLYVRHWPAAPGVLFRGCLFMVHGLTWHSKYFADTAAQLNAKGFDVITHDLPAHGLSGSLLGIQGYHVSLESYVHSVTAVMQDALQRQLCSPPNTQHTSSQNSSNGNSSNAKLFLYGESFGAAVVLHALLRHPELAEQLTGAIAAGVPIGLPEVLPPAPVLAVAQLIARLYPFLPMPKGSSMQPEEYVKAFGNEELARKALQKDPAVGQQPLMGMMNVILPTVETLEAQLPNITLPLLIMHGLNDTRVGHSASQLLYDKAGSTDKL